MDQTQEQLAYQLNLSTLKRLDSSTSEILTRSHCVIYKYSTSWVKKGEGPAFITTRSQEPYNCLIVLNQLNPDYFCVMLGGNQWKVDGMFVTVQDQSGVYGVHVQDDDFIRIFKSICSVPSLPALSTKTKSSAELALLKMMKQPEEYNAPLYPTPSTPPLLKKKPAFSDVPSQVLRLSASKKKSQSSLDGKRVMPFSEYIAQYRERLDSDEQFQKELYDAYLVEFRKG